MNAGDVVDVDFGTPVGSEAGFVRPAVVVTADGFLRYRPTTVFVVPLTSSPRLFPSHIDVPPDDANGLSKRSTALVEQLRAVAVERCGDTGGSVGPAIRHQILDVLATIIGMP